MSLASHFPEGLVMHKTSQLSCGNAALFQVVIVGPGKGIHIGVHGKVAVHQRGAGIIRAPKIINIRGVYAAYRGDAQQARLRADEESHGTGSLGGLPGSARRVAGDIRGDDQHLFLRVARHDTQGALQRRGAPVTGFFHFHGAHMARQLKESMEENPGGFRLIHPGFGSENDGADSRGTGGGQEACPGLGPQGDGVLIEGRDAHMFLAEPHVVLTHGHIQGLRHIRERQAVMRSSASECVNADIHLVLLSA